MIATSNSMGVLKQDDYEIVRKILGKVPVKPVGKYLNGNDKYLRVVYKDNLFIFENSYEIKDKLKVYGLKYVPELKGWAANKQQFLLVSDSIWEHLSINDRIKAWRFGLNNKYTQELSNHIKGVDYDKREDSVRNNVEQYISRLRSSEFGKILRDYQIDAVRMICNAYLSGQKGFILGDEQGLGKTLMSIAFLHVVNAYNKNVLILTKKPLVYNFYREILEYDYYGMSSYISFKPQIGKICIIPHSSLTSKVYNDLSSISWDIIIFDEVQAIKNTRSKRTRNFVKMINLQSKLNIKYFILALTGTLIKNRTMDGYVITKLIGIHNLNPYAFAKKYEGVSTTFSFNKNMRYAKYYRNIDPNAVAEFRNMLYSSGLYLRRTKNDVISELPNKNRIFRVFEMNEKGNTEFINAYNNEQKIYDMLNKKINVDKEILQNISYYRRVIAYYKVDYIINYIEEFEDLDRLVVFAHHNDVIDKLYNLIRNKYSDIDLRKIYGRTTEKDRKASVEAFQGDSDDKIWILASYSVASEGLTLTKANNMIFAELDWSVSNIMQAEDRIHRISQNKTCNYYYFIALKTLDQYIYNVLNDKISYLKNFSKESDIFGFVKSDID
ncbi:MAG: DEAD/DEAH box helicase [Candidatus Aenigmatarchaeota archaeon]